MQLALPVSPLQELVCHGLNYYTYQLYTACEFLVRLVADYHTPFTCTFATADVNVVSTARVLASQAEAIVHLRRTWPQHRIDIH